MKRVLIGVLLAACSASLFAADKPLTGKLLCGIASSVDCASNGACLEGEASDVNLPTLLAIDLGKKTVAAAGEHAGKQGTGIEVLRRVGDRILLGGADANKAWSAVISINTGALTATIADHEGAILLFGKCMIAP